MGNTSEGAKKGAKTQIEIHGPNYFEAIGALGGAHSTHRPMKDPNYARKLVNIRWAKARAKKENK